ncbi:MAG: hypothetical protein SVT56_13200 [Chloroflexota bacterium]|nr:hypothetical protein [Chloroflexota bacterium]
MDNKEIDELIVIAEGLSTFRDADDDEGIYLRIAQALRKLKAMMGEYTDRGVTDEFTDAARKRLADSIGEISEDMHALTVMNMASIRIQRLNKEVQLLRYFHKQILWVAFLGGLFVGFVGGIISMVMI